MNKAQSELFDSLLDYWQKVVNELTDSIEDNYKMSSGLTARMYVYFIAFQKINSEHNTIAAFLYSVYCPPHTS